MIWLYLVAVALLGAVVVVLTGRGPVAASPAEELPAGPGSAVFDRLAESRSLSAEDLDQVRFDSSLRGYNMEQVDRLIDALSVQLREQQGAAQPSGQGDVVSGR